MFFFSYWWTYLLIIPGLLLMSYAQIKVSTTFSKYKQIHSKSDWTANDMARMMLEKNGVYGVNVQKCKGHLTDHYDPKKNTLFLSESVYDSNSIASLGVAAHEVGHAIQHAKEYLPLKLRSILVPITNFGTMLAFPLVLFGIFLELLAANFESLASILILVGIICYGLATVFSLVTLPVEFDASRRAQIMLKETGVLTKDEAIGSRKVLSAAALTYLASFLVSLLYFLRFLLIIARMRGNKD